MSQEVHPTPEEEKRADEIMTPTQKDLSGYRERHIKRREQAGASGYFYTSDENINPPANLEKFWHSGASGMLKGHDIKLSKYAPKETGHRFYEGKFDGKDLSQRDAALLWFKYIEDVEDPSGRDPILLSEHFEEEAILKAIEEVKEETRQKQLQDSMRDTLKGLLE